MTNEISISSSVAEMPVKIQSDTINIISDIATSRLHEIWSFFSKYSQKSHTIYLTCEGRVWDAFILKNLTWMNLNWILKKPSRKDSEENIHYVYMAQEKSYIWSTADVIVLIFFTISCEKWTMSLYGFSGLQRCNHRACTCLRCIVQSRFE